MGRIYAQYISYILTLHKDIPFSRYAHFNAILLICDKNVWIAIENFTILFTPLLVQVNVWQPMITQFAEAWPSLLISNNHWTLFYKLL